ncbi:MAG: hypothetical protein FJ135_00470 [Deltaproteobacteria bacterium]|nr:hypothetical protein [Deltaproteobacteria bacterium]
MKKICLLTLAVAMLFCVPLTAHGKADFELGGYIRMDAIWNSHAGAGHALATFLGRDNVANNNHGRFAMNANATRFNLTMKGPEVWGGKVTGFIEVDFDGGDPAFAQARNAAGDVTSYIRADGSSFNQAKLRLRHAMFKMAWPDREIILGQFWSVNSELIPETADSGGYCLYGATQLRNPQVRYTQKFLDYFSTSLAISHPISGRWGLNLDATNPLEGETSETPMLEAKFRYEQDLYGKAAWYGKPRPFYVGIGMGYLRTRNTPQRFVNSRSQNYIVDPTIPTPPGTQAMVPVAGTAVATNNFNTLGNSNFQNPNIATPGAFLAPVGPLAQNITNNLTMNARNMRYHDHWLFLIENFTPIIPTVTQNLAGSLGLAHQWWVGQGLSAWRLDMPGADRYFNFAQLTPGVANSFDYDMTFIKRYGGWAQLQYYFTNEIFTNVNFGFEKAFGFDGSRNIAAPGGFNYANPVGNDPVSSTWRVGVTQWYRPVAALKFGLQYTYLQTRYFQYTTVGTTRTNSGGNHSLMATGYFFF